MANAPNCPNPTDLHRTSWVPMTRLYIREKVPGTKYGETAKRKWLPIGWHCHSVESYSGKPCGHVQLDTAEGSQAAA